MGRFASLVRSAVANAAGYRSELACHAMIARIRRAWERAGCYGCNAGARDEAINAVRDRLFELSYKRIHGEEAW